MTTAVAAIRVDPVTFKIAHEYLQSISPPAFRRNVHRFLEKLWGNSDGPIAKFNRALAWTRYRKPYAAMAYFRTCVENDLGGYPRGFGPKGSQEKGEERRREDGPKMLTSPPSSFSLLSIERRKEAEILWVKAKAVIGAKIPRSAFNTFYAPVEALGFIQGSLVLKATAVIADQLERGMGWIVDAIGCEVEVYVAPEVG